MNYDTEKLNESESITTGEQQRVKRAPTVLLTLGLGSSWDSIGDNAAGIKSMSLTRGGSLKEVFFLLSTFPFQD